MVMFIMMVVVVVIVIVIVVMVVAGMIFLSIFITDSTLNPEKRSKC
jgi:NADH:ubiquinone oxidoreductase subunit 3 (subunit A)